MELSVVLDKKYTENLKKEISNMVLDVIKYEAQRLAPPKRYFTKTDLMKFLKIGDVKFEMLRRCGLKVIIVGYKSHLYDIEDVYSILETLKE